MEKLYTESDMRKAFLAGSNHNIDFSDYIKKKKGRYGIFKNKMHVLLEKHLWSLGILFASENNKEKSTIQKFYHDLVK